MEQDAWEPAFDPIEFNKEHGPLQVDDYSLTPEELHSWARRAVEMRKGIEEKARKIVHEEPIEAEE